MWGWCRIVTEIILPSWRSNHLMASTMTSCSATGVRRAAGFQGRSPIRIQHWSAEPEAAHWCGRALVLAVLHCLGFSKNKVLLEGDCENHGLLRARLKRNQSFSVSLYDSHDGNFSFLLIFGIAVYEVRERESIKERQHWKQDFLKRPSQCRPCAVIWSVLTELSRGMEKIIRRNVWGALKRSRPRDWPMGERPAERRANFFLMNSTACSTM